LTMFQFLLLVFLLGFASSAGIYKDFMDAGYPDADRHQSFSSMWAIWRAKHNKKYTSAQETIRFGIFIENYYRVQKFNEANDDLQLALNKFADLTPTEFKQKYTGCGHYQSDVNFIDAHTAKIQVGGLPDSVDWRNKGAVTPVKNQGQCGSCWSFSTTGLLEGIYFVKNGKLLSLSEQQIVDCDISQNEGCNGGWPYLAVQYAAKNGIELEDDYPYTARDGNCEFEQSKAVKVTSGYQFVTANSSDSLKAALVNNPVSVLIEADQSIFQLYSQGVIKTGCGAELDHAVLAVGYQKVGLWEAFIVKNSWGEDWGQEGYVYISTIGRLNKGQGVCGILAQPLIAI